MRLNQIKLAGFKSFVDPTTVHFPDNLTAIVGPNGCGKSNLIDAVRWVMGESSAKNLRGDSMTDVIFNGSAARKPVSQASIELLFDNSDGTVTGEYASFNEIAVKRQVNREGVSTYSLNGSVCRRKDITSIFLGTGLGPRSYAIIEQGMISRLIESKPQELRVFIEEAAGISKYKERRRETETRIKNTRDNLDRLSDLREELGRQLAHLQRQATSAEKYRHFKIEERQLKAELIALRWQGFNEQLSRFDSSIKTLEVELESKHADQRAVESSTELAREKHTELTDSFNEVQGRFYGVAAEIARIEQSIKHSKQRRQQFKDDLSRLNQAEKNALEHINHDDKLIAERGNELAALSPGMDKLRLQAEDANQNLLQADEKMHGCQQDWDRFQQLSAAVNQKVEVEQTKILHCESLLERSKHRLNRFRTELASIKVDPEEAELKETADQLQQDEAAAETLGGKLSEAWSKINLLRESRDAQQKILSQLHQDLQSLQGREVTLNALQKAALGTDHEPLKNWLSAQGIEHKNLAAQINVESGWELAVETVLGKLLEAVPVEDFEALAESLQQLEDINLNLISAANHQVPIRKGSILAKINSQLGLPSWLNSVYTAENFPAALLMQNELAEGGSVITSDGFWLGADWLQVIRKVNNDESVLVREKELRELSALITEKQQQYQQLDETLQQCITTLRLAEDHWQQLQQQVSKSTSQIAELSSKVASLRTSLQHNQGRWTLLTNEIAELEKQRLIESEKLVQSRVTLEQDINVMAKNNLQKEQLSSLRETYRTQLEGCRIITRECKEEHHRSALRVESLTAQLESAQMGKQRAESQLGELGERKEQLRAALAEDSAPIDALNEELNLTLERHQQVEKELAEQRITLDDVDHEIRQLDGKRHLSEQNAEAVRHRLESLRMDWQGIKVRRSNEEEQLQTSNTTVEEIMQNLPDDASDTDWQDKLEKMAMKIQRLGAINLAAIDEYKTQSERKAYLDAQNDDLCKALDTLENAIRKIDKETRNRFQETFEKVSKGLQELFPKVFGGGHAYLELTGDDLLSTGVTVMARPPGKRNSTIHQLSGGEKALTAISLVFAIFQMKPAPFCMLDEVDASLDDANVARFCRLVKEMSKTVQFIYISHNKGAIEMAHHLAGVTMQEPGVSRMVSVDIEEATSLAAANA